MVLYENQLVGELTSIDRILHFTYSKTWLDDPNSFALCPQIPLKNRDYQSEPVLFFFSNLLPEGPVLDALLKLKRLPQGDIFAQLNAFGEDAAGAFSITPEIRKSKTEYRLYPQEQIEKDLKKMSRRIPLLASHADLRLSLAGAQNKITVKLDNGELYLPLAGAPSTHILKPEIEPKSSIPNSVENEAFCLKLAQIVGLNVVEANILYYSQPLLLIKRYDRIIEPNKIRRLHQLDFCQLKGVLPDQKYQKDSGPSFLDIFELINRYSYAPAKDRLQIIDWILFNYIIGNADAHGKNIAMMHKKNAMELTPFYDLISTAIYELDEKMAMSIGGAYRPEWVLTEHWKKFATEIGINFNLFCSRAQHLLEKLSDAIPVTITELSLDPKMPLLKKIQKVIAKRSRILESRLSLHRE